jgi:hypothetical protein
MGNGDGRIMVWGLLSKKVCETLSQTQAGESLLPFPAWGTRNVSPSSPISPYFYSVILSFLINFTITFTKSSPLFPKKLE